MSDQKKKKTDDDGSYMIFGMLIGMSIGLALGQPLFDNMDVGMASERSVHRHGDRQLCQQHQKEELNFPSHSSWAFSSCYT